MAGSTEPSATKPKKPFSKGKLILYGLALLGLAWVTVEAYWGYFKLKLWLKGFGTGVFWVFGLIAGFVYTHMAYKFSAEIQAKPNGAVKIGRWGGYGLALAVLNPFLLGLAVWFFTPQGSLHTASLWFFFGALLGAILVVGVEKLFAKKKPKPVA